MREAIALPRGARLLAEPAAGARSFACGFWFPTGSRHEAPRERGFAHFAEHLLFKGTEARDALAIAREIDRVGGYLNAFTEKDLVCVHCLVPASRWRLALEVLVDLAFRSTFPEEEVERERGVIESEILAARDEPEEASHESFIERIWAGHPMGLKIAGEPEDIAAARREDLLAFYRDHFRPDRLLASASGPMPAAEVAAELARLLDALPARERRAAGAPAGPGADTPPFHAICEFEPARAEQVYLYEAAQLGPPFAPADYYPLSAFSLALGESTSSRLFQALRERGGLCYSVYASFSVSRSECFWVAQASCSPAQFPRLLSALDAELEAALGRGPAPRPISDEEVAEAVTRLEGGFELSLDDVESRMKRLARQYLADGLAWDEEETFAAIRVVSPAAARAAGERLLGGAPRARFAYGKAGKRALAAMGLDARGVAARQSAVRGGRGA